MFRKSTIRVMAAIGLAMILASSTGCNRLVNSALGGWVAGLLTAQLTGEQTCYRNGVLVDCSELVLE